MANFVFTYRAPKGAEPDASPEIPKAWQTFLDGLGSHLVDAGNPVFEQRSVGRVANTNLGGYSIISADDVETAMKLAQDCPMVAIGGGVEVGVLTLLNQFKPTNTTAADHARATDLVS